MNKDEALKMAIEFMGTLTIDVGIKTWNEKHRKEAIQACKEALEQPAMTYEQGFDHGYEAYRVEQELEQPAQDFFERGKEIAKWADKQNEQPAQEPIHNCPNCNSLFTKEVYSTPALSWQGLNGDELNEIVDRLDVSLILDCSISDFVGAIEAKLKEKNHG